MNKLAKLKAVGGEAAAESMGARTKGKGKAKPEAGPKLADVDPRFAGVESAGTLRDIRVETIEPDPEQPRKYFDPTALDELARSLKEEGQIQPAVVYWHEGAGKYRVVVGERRYRACVKAGIASLTCRVLDSVPDPNDLPVIQLTENISRSNFLPMEEARAYRETLRRLEIPARELAARLGIDASRITRLTALLDVAPTVQRLVESGDLSPAAAYELSKVKDQGRQATLATQAMEAGWSRDVITAKVAETREAPAKPRKPKGPEPAPAPPPPPPAAPAPRPAVSPPPPRPTPSAVAEARPDGGEIAPCNSKAVVTPIRLSGYGYEHDEERVRTGIFGDEIQITTEIAGAPHVLVAAPDLDFDAKITLADATDTLRHALAIFRRWYGPLGLTFPGAVVASRGNGIDKGVVKEVRVRVQVIEEVVVTIDRSAEGLESYERVIGADELDALFDVDRSRRASEDLDLRPAEALGYEWGKPAEFSVRRRVDDEDVVFGVEVERNVDDGCWSLWTTAPKSMGEEIDHFTVDDETAGACPVDVFASEQIDRYLAERKRRATAP